MAVEDEIVARLVADAGVSALVADRVAPLKMRQNTTMPAVTYQRISGPRLQELSGATDRGMARIQIDSWASDADGARALGAAVRISLNGFIGTLDTVHAVIRLDNERDWYEDDPGLYRVIQDYRVNHTE